MLKIFPFFLLFSYSSAQCSQCGNGLRYLSSGYGSFPQKRYSFNFDQFFNGRQFSSYGNGVGNSPSIPAQRILNVYGQDAEAFGSAIGRSIAQRIQQAYAQQDATTPFDVKFSPPSTPIGTSSSLPTSPAMTSSIGTSSSYGTSSIGTSSIGTTSPTRGSTHPPEDLPTVQQAFATQPISFGSTPSMTSSNNFGGLPGLLPPPGAQTNGQTNGQRDCPWCGGFRAKRKEEEEKN